MSILTTGVILLGFLNTYGRRLWVAQEPVSPVIHVHAFLFTTWLFVFIAQCVFASRRKMALHVKLGSAGIILAGMMLFAALAAALESLRQGHLGIPGVLFPSKEGFFLLNMNSALIFTILTFAAWTQRHQPETHKRWMLMATVAGLAPPGISRLPLIAGHTPLVALTVIAFVSAGPIHDWLTTGRVHRAYLYSLPLVVLILPPVVAALASLFS